MYYRRKILLSILERSTNQTITKLSLQKILFSKSSFPIMPNSTVSNWFARLVSMKKENGGEFILFLSEN